MRKMMFLAGMGAGYVLGAKAGRERYDMIRAKWDQMWENPTVQETAGVVQSKATEVYESAKNVVNEKMHRGSDDREPQPVGTSSSPYPSSMLDDQPGGMPPA